MTNDDLTRGHWSAQLLATKLATPAYVYSVSEVARRIRALKEALRTPVVISLKACPNHDILSRLPADCLDGLEVASRGELHMVAGMRLPHFYVNTPALTDTLVRGGLGAKASFIVDMPQHLSMIAGLRGQREVRPLMLRLTNKLIGQYCPDAPTLRDDQFGMDLEQALTAIDLAQSLGFEIGGVHLYAGPHTFGRAARHVVDTMLAVVPTLEARLGYPLRTANLGGGLEERWPEKGYDFGAYRAALTRLPSHIEVIHEFGRAIFSSAGSFAVRVLFTKTVAGQRYAVCDGGMAQAFLLAQTENILRKYRTPWVAKSTTTAGQPSSVNVAAVEDSNTKRVKTIITGSTCSRDDVIGETFDTLAQGDVLVFDNCGAYHRTYSMNNFLLLGEPSVYVI
jgi:diaminopimelate decarboxylase